MNASPPLSLRTPDDDYRPVFPECIDCRGKKSLCGLDPCPLLLEVRNKFQPMKSRIADRIEGPSPPQVFVGRHGYPDVRVGPSTIWSQDNATPISDPAQLYGRPIEEVATRHAGLVTGGQSSKVWEAKNPGRVLAATQEIAMAEKEVEIGIGFRGPVDLSMPLTFDSMSRPLGPSGVIEDLEVIGHARISRKVDAIVEETDLLATDAMDELSMNGVGEAHLSRLLSSGLLGKDEQRRLVPTRWSITATDSALGDRIWSQIPDYPSLDKIHLHRSEYLDNRFWIITAPGSWAFQMSEAWMKGSLWSSHGNVSSDWEDQRPRTKYADNVTGAYYAARLAVLEHFKSTRRSGSAFVWRDIGPGYWAPVGVWLIREACREALNTIPQKFDTLNDAISTMAAEASSPREVMGSWFAKRMIQAKISDYL